LLHYYGQVDYTMVLNTLNITHEISKKQDLRCL
jgi:hypothetical protein